MKKVEGYDTLDLFANSLAGSLVHDSDFRPIFGRFRYQSQNHCCPMSATPNNDEQSALSINVRTKKWVLWNAERIGRRIDEHGNEIGEITPMHWIIRFKGRVWRYTLAGLLRLMRHERANEPTPFQGWCFYILGGAVSSVPAFLVGLAVCWVFGLAALLDLISKMARDQCGFYAAFGILVLFGICAYLLRRWFRSCYGAAELFFSAWALWSGLTEISSHEPNATKATLGIFGGLYVMVRALDNIEQGWSEAGRAFAAIAQRPTRHEVEAPVTNPPQK